MIRFDRFTYRYPKSDKCVLDRATFKIPDGAFTLVVGPSGAGKSTLVRCINGLVPHFTGGHASGSVSVQGLDPIAEGPQAMSRLVGMVFQDPEAQFIVDDVESEVAFSLENAAVPAIEIGQRIAQALEMVGIADLRQRRVQTLSGGERQRVAIAAALALRPQVLLLDEPTSQLDPTGADDVLRALVRLNDEAGLTVVLVEHRLERVLPYADLMLHVSSEGEVRCARPRELLADLAIVPPIIELARELGWSPLPLTISEAREHAQRQGLVPKTSRHVAQPPHEGEPLIAAREVTCAYGDRVAVQNASLSIWPGEIVALMGPNGAGKSTLVRSLVGLIQPQRGSIRVAGEDISGESVADICLRLAMLPQDPNALLFAESVRDELEITLRNHGRDPATQEHAQAIDTLLAELGLARLAQRYPRDLSAGERQRTALASVTITSPRAVILDEPTRGLDYAAKRSLISLLDRWRRANRGILLVTHDVELTAALADRVVLMSGGAIVASGPAQEVLRKGPFAPQIAQIFPNSGWLTVQDALRGMGNR
jgi:energy-coupling factor transport system ATP-binding protein